MEPQQNHMLAPASHRQSSTTFDAEPPNASSVPPLTGLSSPSAPLPLHRSNPSNFAPPPPPYRTSSELHSSASSPNTLVPDVPDAAATELPGLSPRSSLERPRSSAVVLPSLSSITGDIPRPDAMMLNHNQPTAEMPSWPPLSAYPPHGQHPPPSSLHSSQSLHGLASFQHPHPPSLPLPALQRLDSPATMDLDASSNSAASATSPDRQHAVRSASLNLDDPDVRLAAEALGDLRADFLSSPPSTTSLLPSAPTAPAPTAMSGAGAQASESEPLLALLTTSHPLLATTIEGATSAYGGVKNFSPRFKSSAEYVEGYLTPIANTVGSVGRVTGVEGGVRWFLGAGRRHGTSSSDQEVEGNSKKRRKVDSADDFTSHKRLEAAGPQQLPFEPAFLTDSYPSTPKGDRRLSMASTVDTLPAYDDLSSPAYTEMAVAQKPASSSAAWQSRLIMSTSGLSVAMSKESLRSLKFCLYWLQWANKHMAHVIEALKTTLEQYEQSGSREARQMEESDPNLQTLPMVGDHVNGQQSEEARGELADRIGSLKNDILKTLQDVINTVSKYAGGALPENAKVLVRRHLTSLPQRFRVATMSQSAEHGNGANSESAIREGAQKVMVLAKEGLDMVIQVSGVVDGTIVSAEEWLDRMGKRREPEMEEQQQQHQSMLLPAGEKSGQDVTMS